MPYRLIVMPAMSKPTGLIDTPEDVLFMTTDKCISILILAEAIGEEPAAFAETVVNSF